MLSYIFFLEYICCHIHCFLNTFAVVSIVYLRHLLSYSMFIENIFLYFSLKTVSVVFIIHWMYCCHIHCKMNMFSVIFIVYWINVPSSLLFIEFIWCHIHCSLNTLDFIFDFFEYINLVSYSENCSLNTFAVIFLFIDRIWCRIHCLFNTFAVIFIKCICCCGHCSLNTNRGHCALNTSYVLFIAHCIYLLSYTLFLE